MEQPSRSSNSSSSSSSNNNNNNNNNNKNYTRSSSSGEIRAQRPGLSHKKSTSISSLSSYNTKPICKHYALNNQILSAFDALYDQKEYKGAYAFGIQFVEVALLEIPKHGYFYSKRHAKERMAHSQSALRVADQLIWILDRLQKQASPADWDRVQKFKALAQEQVSFEQRQILLEETYEQDRYAVETDLWNTSSASDYLLCGNIMEYAELLLCPASATTEESMTVNYPSKDHPLLTAPKLVSQSSESSISDLERALFVSGGLASSGGDPVSSHHASQMAGASSHHHPHRHRRSTTAIDMASLQLCYHEDFGDLCQRGRVRISQVVTHQGRLPGSVNGCTVIAPLLCVHHFHNNWDDGDTATNQSNRSHDSITASGRNNTSYRSVSQRYMLSTASAKTCAPDAGLLDAVITEVIDFETPAILPQVRENLGLTRDALIIPSDVHDFLIEKQLLASEQFVTVVGGNILDDAHVSGFVNHLLLADDGSGKGQRKLAATFFFHEHVIAILRLQQSDKEIWFDVIDSLPNPETLRKVGESSPVKDSYSDYFMDGDDDIIKPPNASRIRCRDAEALKLTIKWFACSRFTNENKQYIDMYGWDELYSDFDPRVFQAFVWAEMK